MICSIATLVFGSFFALDIHGGFSPSTNLETSIYCSGLSYAGIIHACWLLPCNYYNSRKMVLVLSDFFHEDKQQTFSKHVRLIIYFTNAFSRIRAHLLYLIFICFHDCTSAMHPISRILEFVPDFVISFFDSSPSQLVFSTHKEPNHWPPHLWSPGVWLLPSWVKQGVFYKMLTD